MVVRTFIDRNNTLVSNSLVNTARNPVTELFYGGVANGNTYSRFIFHFDETRLRQMYNDGTFTDLSKLTHTLKLTNTASFNENLVNGTYAAKDRASSFNLILFKVNQPWDEGTGYDYSNDNIVTGDYSISSQPSNWFYPQIGINWTGGTGVYSGSPSGITVSTQHFDTGNENIVMDITPYVNGLITGNTNYGLGIAFDRPFEAMSTPSLQYVGFFTRHTQTFYEPFVETIYSNVIKDDRNNFFLDKVNKLYLYVNLAGTPTNLDVLPSVKIYDQNEVIFSSITAVTHVTKGVYSIDLLVPTTNDITKDYLFTDVWTNIIINGIRRPDVSLSIELMDSSKYYNIGDIDELSKRVAVSISGVKNLERIKRGDIRKVIVSTRIPYTVEQTQTVTSLKYRLYVTEGRNEVTVIDLQPVEMASNYNYFLIDTQSLIPGIYYVDVQVESNLEVNTLRNVVSFEIISESLSRTV